MEDQKLIDLETVREEDYSPHLVSSQESRKRNIILSAIAILFLLFCICMFTFVILTGKFIIQFSNLFKGNRTYQHNFGVASNSNFATKVGYEVLVKGGNVVDAMVAIQYTFLNTITY
jgi:hypothetical protein